MPFLKGKTRLWYQVWHFYVIDILVLMVECNPSKYSWCYFQPLRTSTLFFSISSWQRLHQATSSTCFWHTQGERATNHVTHQCGSRQQTRRICPQELICQLHHSSWAQDSHHHGRAPGECVPGNLPFSLSVCWMQSLCIHIRGFHSCVFIQLWTKKLGGERDCICSEFV